MSVESSKIKIFPCVSRTYDTDEADIKAKLMSEENITNIIKSITDKKSYIISYDDVNKIFKFVLNGYYIELKAEKRGNLYVYMEDMVKSGNHTLIYGDSDNYFKGISTSEIEPDKSVKLCLCLNGEIPNESYLKFNSSSFTVDTDFGELN